MKHVVTIVRFIRAWMQSSYSGGNLGVIEDESSKQTNKQSFINKMSDVPDLDESFAALRLPDEEEEGVSSNNMNDYLFIFR
jgi:hypothetical protein